VQAGTAGPAADEWTSALPCRRRPGHRRCAGRIIIARSDEPASIAWRCDACGDQGVISGWEGSPYDLRRRRPQALGTVRDVAVTDEVAAALRELSLLDADSERLVYSIRASGNNLLLTADEDDLDELVDSLAAEANHEPDRRRQKRLDAAFEALSSATDTSHTS
jgi:hypothetical protein